MKVFKLLLFLILLVVIGGTIYFGAKDGAYTISNTYQMKAPKAVVYDIVNDYSTWNKWHPSILKDSTLNFSFSEKTIGKDAYFSWDGKFSGRTKTDGTNDSTVYQTETFKTPHGEREQEISWNFRYKDINTVDISIERKGEHSFLDKVYFGIVDTNFEQMYEDLHIETLKDLETFSLLEMNKFEISDNRITEYGGGFYVYITSNATTNNMSSIMATNYEKLKSFLTKNGISIAGMPFTMYYEMNQTGAVMANALPVNEKVDIPNDLNILSGYIPKCKVVKTSLKGNYIYLSNAWENAQQYVSQYELVTSELNPFEIYTNDPGDHPNPADWTTDLYIPIK